MPPDLKKKLFPDDEPADPAKVRQQRQKKRVTANRNPFFIAFRVAIM